MNVLYFQFSTLEMAEGSVGLINHHVGICMLERFLKSYSSAASLFVSDASKRRHSGGCDFVSEIIKRE